MLKNINCHIILFKRFISALCIFLSLFYILSMPNTAYADDDDKIKSYIENIFLVRNKAILSQDLDSIQSL